MNNPGLMNHEKIFRLICTYGSRAPTTFKLEGEVEDNREKWERLLGEVNCD